MKKRVLSLLLALIMVFVLASCGEKTQKEPEIEIKDDPTANLKLSAAELPRIDGATAMLPYYQEMVARLLDIPSEEAAKYIQCNTTTQAYENLANGTVDVIFCAPPSDAQIEYAASQGVTMDCEQVLNSGFVFFVNKSNPVNSVTKQQLHDIYAGKITNWKEVGGDDEPIIAYQRSEGSGSQSGLYQHLIPQSEVMEAPIEHKIDAMAGIIDAVAEYDNAKSAIGYSYYYYITNMHYQEEVKLLAIDNIYPTSETISAGMYPFISKTAVYFNSSQAEDSVVRKIAAWCSGSAGNKLAEDLGYVPNKEAKTIIPAYKESKPTEKIAYQLAKNNLELETIESEPDEYGYSQYRYIQIHGLKDAAVEDKINAKIKEVYDNYLNTPYEPKYIGAAHNDVEIKCNSIYASYTWNANNLLSVCFNAMFADEAYTKAYYENTGLTFNLKTGDVLKLGDLFDNKENGFAYINKYIYDNAYLDGMYYYDGIMLAAPFEGIKDNQKFYLQDANAGVNLIFDYDTPEFYCDGYTQQCQISLQGYFDFEKFMTKQSLFIDDTKNYSLIMFDLGVGDYSDVTIDSSFFGDRNIYWWNSFIVYDGLPDNINKILGGDQARVEKLGQEIIELYDGYKAQGHNVSGEVSCRSSVVKYGHLYNVSETYSSYLYNQDIGTGETTVSGEYNSYCFKEGSNEPLLITDIFKEGVDWKAVLREAMIKSVENIGESSIYDPKTNTMVPFEIDASNPQFLAYVDAALLDVKGFSFTTDGMYLRFNDLTDIYNKTITTETMDVAYMYENAITSLTFTEIGTENLNIFE